MTKTTMETEAGFSVLHNLLQQIQSCDGKNKDKIEAIVQKFGNEFVSVLLSLTPRAVQDADFGEKLLAQIAVAQEPRDLFFDFVEVLIKNDLSLDTIVGVFFEKVYNETYIIERHGIYYDEAFEFQRFIIWEMFIGLTTILLHTERYCTLNTLLNRSYYLKRSPQDENPEASTFITFRALLDYIEDCIQPKDENPNLPLVGKIVVNREKKPIITRQSLVDADMVLFQLSMICSSSGHRSHWGWYPMLYVYGENNPLIWHNMISRVHCEKLFPLFGVTELEQLKEVIEKSKPYKSIAPYPCFSAPPALIQQCIELEKIGTLP